MVKHSPIMCAQRRSTIACQPASPNLSPSFSSPALSLLRTRSEIDQSSVPRGAQLTRSRTKLEPVVISELGVAKSDPRGKRFTVCVPNPTNPLFADFNPRKSAEKIREELGTLKAWGVTTSSAVPSELEIFKNRNSSKLTMSSFDLWGPNHARQAMRSFGYTEAYRAMEQQDRRHSIKVEGVLSHRFSPRVADDVSTMKALNTPMVRSGALPALPNLKPEKCENAKTKSLQSIECLCDQLSRDNKEMRRSLTMKGKAPA